MFSTVKQVVKRGLKATGIETSVLRYWLTLSTRKLLSLVLALRPHPDLSAYPPVTLFVINTNNRYPLELTLRSIHKYTSYPNYQIWVADNASDDDSRTFLEKVKDPMGLNVIYGSSQKEHGEWLDYAAEHVETPFWVGIDEDMYFLQDGWLTDMMRIMIDNPDLYLLCGEGSREKWNENHVIPNTYEPVSGAKIDKGEYASTWLFCVRTSLRDRVESSFLFHEEGAREETGNMLCYDTSGKIMAEMREKSVKYDYMPSWFKNKFFHFGNMACAFKMDRKNEHFFLKRYQLQDIKRRLQNESY